MTVSLLDFFESKVSLDDIIESKISFLKVSLLPLPPQRINDYINDLIYIHKHNIDFIINNRRLLRHFDEWSGKRLDYSRAMIVRLRRLKTEFTIPF